MIQQANDRFMAVKSVKTSGDAYRLASFDAGLFFERRQGEKGKLAVDINGNLNFPSNEEFTLKVGSPFAKSYPGNRQADLSTYPFTKDAIKSIRVSAPTSATPKVDEVIIGYDGVNDATAPIMYPGEVRNVSVRLEGKPVTAAGYYNGFIQREFSVVALSCPNASDNCATCNDCDPVEMYPLFVKLREQIADANVGGGIKISDLADVSLIRDCSVTPSITTEQVEEYTIAVPDSGSLSDLQAVQGTTNGEVRRESYNGGISVYVVRQLPQFPLTNAPYVVRTGSILANCDTCPTGFTASNIGGHLYSVKTRTSVLAAADAVTAFPGTKNGNAIKYEDSKTDVSVVDIITEEAITDAQLNTFMDTDGVLDVIKAGEVATVCTSTATQTYNWQQRETTCTVTKYTFYIDLKRKDCSTTGGEQLEDLQKAYPFNTVAFVQLQGDCMEQYSIEVYSNETCTECGSVSDIYKASKPNPYMGSEWYCETGGVAPSGCKMGIRITGKFMQLVPDDCLEDIVPTYYSSTLVSATAGEPVIDTLANPARNRDPWSVKRISAANEISHMGYKILPYVKKDFQYFLGERPTWGYIRKFFTGESPTLDPLTQYVDYIVEIGWPRRRENGFKLLDYSKFHLIVPFGQHQEVENLVNAMAKIAGLPAVSADASL